jgi:hypothetical protein
MAGVRFADLQSRPTEVFILLSVSRKRLMTMSALCFSIDWFISVEDKGSITGHVSDVHFTPMCAMLLTCRSRILITHTVQSLCPGQQRRPGEDQDNLS